MKAKLPIAAMAVVAAHSSDSQCSPSAMSFDWEWRRKTMPRRAGDWRHSIKQRPRRRSASGAERCGEAAERRDEAQRHQRRRHEQRNRHEDGGEFCALQFATRRRRGGEEIGRVLRRQREPGERAGELASDDDQHRTQRDARRSDHAALAPKHDANGQHVEALQHDLRDEPGVAP